MCLIAREKETDGRGETGRNQERQKCLWPGREQRRGAEHHSTQDENEENLIREVGLLVQKATCCAPANPCQTGANRKSCAPFAGLRVACWGAAIE